MNLRSGDALLALDSDLTIVSWNRAAEELIGLSAEEAVGRSCWEVLSGHDVRGDLICHPGCSIARLARGGQTVASHCLLVAARGGRSRVRVSTIAVDEDDSRLISHLLIPVESRAPPGSRLLTARQQEVLHLLADGLPAKVIAIRLGVVEATARNHIRAILAALGAHSQLEAVASARRLRLLD